MTADGERTPDVETVILGVLPHTHGAVVAHPRPGFIGRANEVRHADALPIHDTNLNAEPGQMSALSGPAGSHASFTANRLSNRRAKVIATRSRADLETWLRPVATALRSLAAVIVAVAGYLLVHAAVAVSTPSDRVGFVAFAVVIVCGSVLIVAQFVGRRSGR